MKSPAPVERPLLLEHLEALARIQDDRIQKRLLEELVAHYVALEKRVDALLKNTLPEAVADEIKYEGRFLPRAFECTILFSDLVGFTKLAERVPVETLIATLDALFTGFDGLVTGFGGTKIKTIGDAYMAVFGAPIPFPEHPVKALEASLAMRDFLSRMEEERRFGLAMRMGVHTGTVMAGVVGRERMQFDIFGDAVNIASRFESSGERDRINVSEATWVRTREAFLFEERGFISLKNKADMRAYFVVAKKPSGG